jgi:chromosomal replication initiator protein
MWIAMDEPGAEQVRPKLVPMKPAKANCSPRKPNPIVEELVARIAAEYGITAEEVFGPSRDTTVMRIRRTAMRQARELYKFSYPELGRFFGRNHRSVMSAIKEDR